MNANCFEGFFFCPDSVGRTYLTDLSDSLSLEKPFAFSAIDTIKYHDIAVPICLSGTVSVFDSAYYSSNKPVFPWASFRLKVEREQIRLKMLKQGNCHLNCLIDSVVDVSSINVLFTSYARNDTLVFNGQHSSDKMDVYIFYNANSNYDKIESICSSVGESFLWYLNSVSVQNHFSSICDLAIEDRKKLIDSMHLNFHLIYDKEPFYILE